MFYGGTGRENRVSPCLLRVAYHKNLSIDRINPQYFKRRSFCDLPVFHIHHHRHDTQRRQKTFKKIRRSELDGSGVFAGVEQQRRSRTHGGVTDELHTVLPIKEQGKRVDGAGVHAQQSFQRLRRTKRQTRDRKRPAKIPCAVRLIPCKHQKIKFRLLPVGQKKVFTVRHILLQIDDSALDTESETYEADLQTLKDETMAKAEDLLAQWKAGEATEDSFAAMANEYSEDPGSNTTGGLYSQVAKGQMVTEFNDWCFDPARQAGDTGIVYGESDSYKGYHVMYFVGNDLPYWQVEVTETLKNNDVSAWYAEKTADYTAEQGSGIRYVG